MSTKTPTPKKLGMLDGRMITALPEHGTRRIELFINGAFLLDIVEQPGTDNLYVAVFSGSSVKKIRTDIPTEPIGSVMTLKAERER